MASLGLVLLATHFPYADFAPISNFSYTYDKVGNRLSMTTQGGTQGETYTYDNLYQLTGVSGGQTHSYQYDPVGNRQLADGIPYTPNPLNQYPSVGGTSYTYNANGNLTNDGTYMYGYDYENRLVSVTGAGLNVSYVYDPFGRRIQKTVNGVVTRYLYDGDQIIAETDNTGAIQAKYTHGPGVDEVLAMQRNGQTYFYYHDGLGSVRDVVQNGTQVELYSYDPYGKVTIRNLTGQVMPESTIKNPFFFTGRELDPETGNYYYRARHYHPGIGRFMQRDPLSYQPDNNLYRYVENNPANWIDPWGYLTVAGPPGPGSIIDIPGKLPAFPPVDIPPPREFKPNIFVPSPPGSTVIADPVPENTGPSFDTNDPSAFPNPGHPPNEWIPKGNTSNGLPQWLDPETGTTWTWHDEPIDPPPHWDIGGPADRTRGQKGKQEWWPEGGARGPKPPGGERMSLPGSNTQSIPGVEPNQSDKNGK